MPIAAGLMSCEEKAVDRQKRMSTELGIEPTQVGKKPAFSPEIISLIKELKKYGNYAAFEVDGSVGYATYCTLVLQASGQIDSAYASNPLYERISINDLSLNKEKIRRNLLGSSYIFEDVRALRYKDGFFDVGQTNTIAKSLKKLGCKYDFFYREGWKSELAFVIPNGILISLTSVYDIDTVRQKYPDPNEPSSIQKAVNFVKNVGKLGLLATFLTSGAEGSGEFAPIIFLCLEYQVRKGIEEGIEDIKRSQRLKDVPSSGELLELEKYAGVVLPGEKIEIEKINGGTYPCASNGRISIRLLGRMPTGIKFPALVREETFFDSPRATSRGDALLAVPTIHPSKNYTPDNIVDISYYLKKEFESIKTRLDQNKIGYQLGYLGGHVVFVLDTPNSVAVLLPPSPRGPRFW